MLLESKTWAAMAKSWNSVILRCYPYQMEPISRRLAEIPTTFLPWCGIKCSTSSFEPCWLCLEMLYSWAELLALTIMGSIFCSHSLSQVTTVLQNQSRVSNWKNWRKIMQDFSRNCRGINEKSNKKFLKRFKENCITIKLFSLEALILSKYLLPSFENGWSLCAASLAWAKNLNSLFARGSKKIPFDIDDDCTKWKKKLLALWPRTREPEVTCPLH